MMKIALILSERTLLPFFLHVLRKKGSFSFWQKKKHFKTKQEN